MLFAADKNAPEDPEALLQKIRVQTIAHLSQLPHYTCHEIINRLVRRGGSVNRVDTVEVEVAMIDGQEIFARAGADSFEERSIDRIVSSGTVGNGAFGTHLEILFSRGEAEFKYAGSGKKEGHQTYRFDFNVPLEKSQFLVKHSGAQGIVAYEGSVWVDTSTLELVRLEIQVKHIASQIGVRSIEEIMHYGVMHIGNTDFLLAHKSELGVMDAQGIYTLNLVELKNCREYKSDSTVQYKVPGQDSAPGQGSASRDAQAPGAPQVPASPQGSAPRDIPEQ
jgi:hypothetical protein